MRFTKMEKALGESNVLSAMNNEKVNRVDMQHIHHVTSQRLIGAEIYFMS